ncbi:hypothetical protein LIT13_01320 [Flavobacterium psychrophilum]|uniref:Uncharacterized protein n=4 Tax=root TaxID=1 RepID=A6GXS5_FLAPJ|nr:hypothetical protein [Flavobacterium psychrophilum]YP_009321840.1 hypothetical protein BOX11_gp19 [Flavobacterium phage 1H]YP_009322897.1 hypothetical protein BOX10_gp25 [Flavobacterium phage 2A]YP_009592332.1 hypothetical protein FDG69_gp24 [Flavobacterium phage 23T]QCW20059.1 hypothetical protein [Flavobacterium phage FPSV-D15]QCW20214.1 hypothetical protein [Flavobacterium phage FPSV-F7]QCW20751.1 hypothetical protein [Flavobacterium phage FPSV-D35]AIT65706.1 hypothetical protein IB65_
MKKFEYIQPSFLFCEIPIKDKSQNDNRIWVYHLKSLSLIEFVCVNDVIDFQFKGIQERFDFENIDGVTEDWFGVFIYNNCELTEHNQNKVLKAAWEYLKEYFVWQDSQHI